jgi:hypothetical protein
MVTKWGLSERLGPLTYSEEDGEIFLGRSVTQHKQVSDVTAHAIDEEIRRSSTQLRARGADPEREHGQAARDGEALIKYETIDEQQIKDIMAGREPRPPADWKDEELARVIPVIEALVAGARRRSRSTPAKPEVMRGGRGRVLSSSTTCARWPLRVRWRPPPRAAAPCA